MKRIGSCLAVWRPAGNARGGCTPFNGGGMANETGQLIPVRQFIRFTGHAGNNSCSLFAQTTFVAILAICVLFHAAAAYGNSFTSPFYTDDFEDGELDDGDPIVWSQSAADVSVSEGSLLLSANRGFGSIWPESAAAVFGDVILRTQVSFDEWHNNADYIGLFARSTSEDCTSVCGDYWGGIRADGIVSLGTFDDLTGQSTVRAWTQTGLNVRSRDVVLEFAVEGRNISIRAWQDGRQMPSRPQLSIRDGRFASGGVGVTVLSEGNAVGTFRYFQTLPVLVGDFNGNGQLDAEDITILRQMAAANSDNGSFDLTGDSRVDLDDFDYWLTDVNNTWYGDANLDGEFNSADLIAVFQEGEFESGRAASWAQGDWNGDGLFDTTDVIKAFEDGGYDLGRRPAIRAVPEPSAIFLLALGMLTIRWLGSYEGARRRGHFHD